METSFKAIIDFLVKAKNKLVDFLYAILRFLTSDETPVLPTKEEIDEVEEQMKEREAEEFEGE